MEAEIIDMASGELRKALGIIGSKIDALNLSGDDKGKAILLVASFMQTQVDGLQRLIGNDQLVAEMACARAKRMVSCLEKSNNAV